MQPVAALIEYTPPPGLPTNTRPPKIEACAFDCRSPGKPNAHFSLSFGTSGGVRPAALALWKRVFEVLTPPQPLHEGPFAGLNAAPAVGPAHMAFGNGAMSRVLRSFLPVAASAIARRSAAL